MRLSTEDTGDETVLYYSAGQGLDERLDIWQVAVIPIIRLLPVGYVRGLTQLVIRG